MRASLFHPSSRSSVPLQRGSAERPSWVQRQPSVSRTMAFTNASPHARQNNLLAFWVGPQIGVSEPKREWKRKQRLGEFFFPCEYVLFEPVALRVLQLEEAAENGDRHPEHHPAWRRVDEGSHRTQVEVISLDSPGKQQDPQDYRTGTPQCCIDYNHYFADAQCQGDGCNDQGEQKTDDHD